MTSLADLIEEGKIYDHVPWRGTIAWYGWMDVKLGFFVDVWYQGGTRFAPRSYHTENIINSLVQVPLWVLSKPFMASTRADAIEVLYQLTNKELKEANKQVVPAYRDYDGEMVYKLVDIAPFDRFEDLD